MTFVFEDHLRESNFSSMALDPKHFILSSILNDLWYYVRVKSFQDTAWELVSSRILGWLSKKMDLKLNLTIACLVDLRHLLFVAFLFFSHTEEFKQARTPRWHLVLKSWIFILYISIEKQNTRNGKLNSFLSNIWFPPHYHFI